MKLTEVYFFDIFCVFTHNIHMRYDVAPIAIMCSLILACIMTLPLRISTSGHFSLGRRMLAVNFKLFGWSAVRLRICVSDDGLRVTVNGKRLRRNKNSRLDKVVIIKQLARVEFNADINAIVGGVDARTTAMLEALILIVRGLPISARLSGETYFNSGNSVEVDGRISTTLSPARILRIVAAIIAA